MLWTKRRETLEEQAAAKPSGKWLRLILQLFFFLFDTLGIFYVSWEAMYKIEPHERWQGFCYGLMLAVFLLTFPAVYKASQKRFLKTVFIQGGGIFTVLLAAAPIPILVSYNIYKAVKESFVIPNFTEQQICAARELFDKGSWLLADMTYGYLSYTILTLIISSVISLVILLIRKKVHRQKGLSESLPNEDTDREILQ